MLRKSAFHLLFPPLQIFVWEVQNGMLDSYICLQNPAWYFAEMLFPTWRLVCLPLLPDGGKCGFLITNDMPVPTRARAKMQNGTCSSDEPSPMWETALARLYPSRVPNEDVGRPDEHLQGKKRMKTSRRQLTPVFDKPAFSRFSQIFHPRLVVHSFGKIVKRQVCVSKTGVSCRRLMKT